MQVLKLLVRIPVTVIVWTLGIPALLMLLGAALLQGIIDKWLS